jgi:hypothetical protein
MARDGFIFTETAAFLFVQVLGTRGCRLSHVVPRATHSRKVEDDLNEDQLRVMRNLD